MIIPMSEQPFGKPVFLYPTKPKNNTGEVRSANFAILEVPMDKYNKIHDTLGHLAVIYGKQLYYIYLLQDIFAEKITEDIFDFSFEPDKSIQELAEVIANRFMDPDGKPLDLEFVDYPSMKDKKIIITRAKDNLVNYYISYKE